MTGNTAGPSFASAGPNGFRIRRSDCERADRSGWLAIEDRLPGVATVCGLPLALSVTLTLADLDPAAVGVNVTLIVHVPLAARVAGLTGHVFVWAKSPLFVPVIPMLLIVKAVQLAGG